MALLDTRSVTCLNGEMHAETIETRQLSGRNRGPEPGRTRTVRDTGQGTFIDGKTRGRGLREIFKSDCSWGQPEMQEGREGVLFLTPGARTTRTMDLGIHIMLNFISELGIISAVDKFQRSQSPG